VYRSQCGASHGPDIRTTQVSHHSFSLRARLRSFFYACAGLRLLLRTQHNARIHAAASIAVVALAGWLRVPVSDWLWLALAITLVWAAEAFNTAIELLADAVTREQQPLIGQAKDVAAAAVLITAIGAAVIGMLVLGPHLLRLLN